MKHLSPRLPRAAVLLDLDDTLFDHTWSSLAGLGALRDRFPELARHPLETLRVIYAHNLEEMHELVLTGELSVEEARTARFRGVLSDCGVLSLDPDQVATLYRAAYQRARRPVPGALELLTSLRGRAKVGIVTNNVVSEQVEKLAHLGMRDLVDVLVISEEMGCKKPDPAIFRAALERLETSASETVMLGDSWGSDVMGAQATGIWPVWLNRTASPCPGPKMCTEIKSLLPTDATLELLLGQS